MVFSSSSSSSARRSVSIVPPVGASAAHDGVASSYRSASRSPTPSPRAATASPSPGGSSQTPLSPNSARAQQGFFKLTQVGPQVPNEEKPFEKEREARDLQRDALYQERHAYWTKRWTALRENLLRRLSQPEDVHEEVKIDLKRACEKDLTIYEQHRKEHSKYRQTQNFIREQENQQRRKEMRALEKEELRRRALNHYSAGRLIEHYSALTDDLLQQEEYRAAWHEFELRDSLRRTGERMVTERRQTAWIEQEMQRVKQEQDEKEAIRRRQIEETAAKQAHQTRLLQLRTRKR